MIKPRLKNFILIIFILFVFGYILYLPYLGTKEFEGEEGRRAFIALEMLENKKFLTPTIFDTPYFTKPPLFNWILALAFHLTNNHSEFIARMVSSTMIILNSIFLCFIWYEILYATSLLTIINAFKKIEQIFIILLPGLIFQTTLEVIDKATKAEIEATYAFIISVAVFSWFYFHEILNKKTLAFTISGLFFGLGILTKTFHAFIFYFPIVLYLLSQKRIKDILSVSHLIGLLVCLGVFLTWIILLQFSGINFIEFLNAWINEYQTKLVISDENVLHHFKSYTLGFLLGFFPWIILLIIYKNKDFKDFLKSEKNFLNFFLFSFLSFSLSYLVHFLLPDAKLRYIFPSSSSFIYILSIPILWLLIYNRFINYINLLLSCFIQIFIFIGG